MQKQYAITLHHLGQYDVGKQGLCIFQHTQGLEEVLAQNPSIEVMIDLHRDENERRCKAGDRGSGKTVARFMFLTG